MWTFSLPMVEVFPLLANAAAACEWTDPIGEILSFQLLALKTRYDIRYHGSRNEIRGCYGFVATDQNTHV